MKARLLPLMAISLLLASPADAQPATGVPVTAKAAAQESYERGNRVFNQAEQMHDRALYEAAYLQFSQAFAIFPDERILWNLIVSEIKTERDVDALRHLRSYDKHQHVTDVPGHPHRALFATFFAQASKATGHLAIEAPVAAQLRLDDADIGVAPLEDPVDVTPGLHQVEARLPGGRTLVASASPAAGEVTHVTLVEPPPEPGPAWTAVQRTAAITSPSPPPERDELTGRQPSFWTARRDAGVGVAAVGVVSLVLSGVFDARSASAANRAAAIRGGSTTCGNDCPALEDAYRSENSDTTWSRVFLSVGIAAAAAGAVLFLWPTSSSPPSASRTALGPVVMPQGGGVQLRGEF
jgi:hypothetical protein